MRRSIASPLRPARPRKRARAHVQSRILHRDVGLAAYVRLAASVLPAQITTTQLAAAMERLFDPQPLGTTVDDDWCQLLRDLHAFIHRATTTSHQRDTMRLQLMPLSRVPVQPAHPLRKKPHFVSLRALPTTTPNTTSDSHQLCFAVPAAASVVEQSLQRLCAEYAALPPRYRVVAEHDDACWLHVDAPVWQALQALQLVASHQHTDAPRFPRLLKHWYVRSGDAAVDRVRRRCVMQLLLTWTVHYSTASLLLDADHPQFDALTPLFELLQCWDSRYALEEALQRSSMGGQYGLVDVMVSLLLLQQPHVMERCTLQWLYRMLTNTTPGTRGPALQASMPTACRYVRDLWNDRAPGAEWVPCQVPGAALPQAFADRLPRYRDSGSTLSFRKWQRAATQNPDSAFKIATALAYMALSPLFNAAEGRRILCALRLVNAPSTLRTYSLYTTQRVWQHWEPRLDTLRQPLAATAAADPATADASGSASTAAPLLAMLEYSLGFRCSTERPARLTAALGDSVFAELGCGEYVRPQQWAVSQTPCLYDERSLLLFHDRNHAVSAVDAVASHRIGVIYTDYVTQHATTTRAAKRPAADGALAGAPATKRAANNNRHV